MMEIRITGLDTLANAITALAGALTGKPISIEFEDGQATKVKEDKKVEKIKTEEIPSSNKISDGAKENAEDVQSTEDGETYTLEQVREKLASLSRSGKRAEVKAIIEGCGVTKLTEIPEEKYAEVMKKAGEL